MMAITLWDRAQSILTCAVDRVDGAVDRPVPDRRFVAPGSEVAWDDCCDGQLWVRILRVFPSTSFPSKTTAFDPCGSALAAQIGVGILRCQTGLDSEGRHPHRGRAHQRRPWDGL